MAADLSVLWMLMIGSYTWPEALRQFSPAQLREAAFVAVLGYLGTWLLWGTWLGARQDVVLEARF